MSGEEKVSPAVVERGLTRADGSLPPETPETTEAVSHQGALARGWTSTRAFRPVLVLTVALFIVMSFANGNFFTSSNVQNILIDVSVLWVVALAQTFALLTGGADLSSGAIIALVGIFIAKTLGHLPGGVVVPLALVFGAAVGTMTNGFFIGRLRLAFFVVTLGTYTAIGGVVTLWSNGVSAAINSPLINALTIDKLAGVAVPIWIMAGTLLCALYVQRRTYFGRNLFAVGGSSTAARLSGIRIDRTLVTVYGLLGLCAALGGVMTVGLAGADNPSVDPSIALEAIAAVLLGGTSLFGGSGGVGGTALGVLFLGVLQDALNLSGVANAWQGVVTGVILIAAVATAPGAMGPLGLRALLTRQLRRPASPDVT